MTIQWTGRAVTARLLLAGALLGLAACNSGLADDLVQVTPKDQVDPAAGETPAGATSLYLGTFDLIARGFSGNGGGTEGVIMMSGMMADEWFHSGTFSTRVTYDQRSENRDNGTVGASYRALHTARRGAERTIAALLGTGSTVANDTRVGEMLGVEALTMILGAETFCSGMPFSADSAGTATIIGTPPLTTQQILDTAIARLDQGISGGTTGNNLNLLRVLKARALMNKGKSEFAAAEALLASVPNSFEYTVFNSTTNNNNGLFVFNTLNERFSMSHNEGINGLPFRGAGNGTDRTMGDPRTPWIRTGAGIGTDVGFDSQSPQYNMLKWTSFDDPVLVASGTEARLMEAEIRLDAGDVAGWLLKLNDLRADGPPGLAVLVDPGTQVGRENLQFSEKAFWLFGEGHRFGDLRRLVRQYGRDPETVFPTGAFFKGGVYGTDVTFPINIIEDQNPAYKAQAASLNIRGCLSNAA